MIVERFLSHVSKLKRTGTGSWIACCPAHEDRSPSMTVRETDDGRVLIHCHAGCSVENILGAVGMTFSDLYPERERDPFALPNKAERVPFNPRDVLEAVSTESLIVAIAGAQLATGEPLKEIDRERLTIAVARLQEAARMCHAN